MKTIKISYFPTNPHDASVQSAGSSDSKRSAVPTNLTTFTVDFSSRSAANNLLNHKIR